jgi:YHS domain-containing protein
MAQETPNLEGIKCIVRTQADAKAETAVDFGGGKVYFCCKNCAAKFQEDSEPFTAAANHQLVATGQFKQVACPVTGKEVAEGITADIGGVEVGLCCRNCKAKIDEAEEVADKLAIAFSKDAFARGFKAAAGEVDLTGVKCTVMPDHDVSADSYVEYNGGRLYFCCDSCIEDFKADPDAYQAAANQQLVQTGQYVQVNCPFSGQPVATGNGVKVGETEVRFCCPNCKGKVEKADDTARAAMVFGGEAFAKAFKPAGGK